MVRRDRNLIVFPCLIVLCAVAGGLLGPLPQSASAAAPDQIRAGLEQFARVYGLIESNFADSLDADKAVYKGAIPAMLRTLDPHSSFYDPRDFRLLREEQNGHYFGVGMLIGLQNHRITVMHPFSGSPAYKAGIRPADVILRINGKSTEGMTTTQAVDLLKGPKGTTVEIAVSREGIDGSLPFSLIRDEISRRSVKQAFWYRPGIAYLHIESFNENTSRELVQAFRQLGQRDIQGLILDLRGNPGGLLNEGVAVAERFLPKGQAIVSHRGRASAEKSYYSARAGAANEYPIVIMVNRYSASAAEIVAGALQDHDRAWIFGESTFGKGLVQSQFPLSEDTALLLTTARYYTPSGRLIQRDYANRSFLDYYSARGKGKPNSADARVTDSGRAVFGGGGITPDEKYSDPELTRFERRLVGRGMFFSFSSSYFARHNPRLAKDWRPDDAVREEFRAFLAARQVPFTAAEFDASREFCLRQLLLEMYTTAFSKEEADRLAVEVDPAVAKAMEALPRSKALLDASRNLLVQRLK